METISMMKGRLLEPWHNVKGKLMQWWITRESVELFKLSIPITLTLVLQQLPLFVSLLFVGWISSEDSSLNLDAAALGTSFINITGSAIILGGSSASTTLSSQSYGYGNYKRVGVIFQRGLLILLLISVFIISVWLNSESLLLLFQQQPCVAKYTDQYVKIMSLSLPSVVLYMTLQQFLQPQNIVWPFILVVFLTNIINAICHAVLIFGVGLGVQGAAVALVISYASQAIILIAYIKIRKLHEKTWGGWTLECLKDWVEYLKLALPGMTMIVAEWSSFEISLLVLGSIDETEQAVSGILMSYLLILFMLPYGIGLAVSIRIGNDLGAGDVKRAKRTVCVTMIITAIEIIGVMLLTIALKDSLGQLYNADEIVQHKLNFMVYITVPLLLTDHLQGSISGILRGAGQQFKVAVVNITSYYVFGLPVGISLAVAADMGAVGMWIGLCIGSLSQAASMVVILIFIKWNKESQVARKRSVETLDSSQLDQLKEVAMKSNVTVELREYDHLYDTTETDDTPHGLSNINNEKPVEETPPAADMKEEDVDEDSDDTRELLSSHDSNQQHNDDETKPSHSEDVSVRTDITHSKAGSTITDTSGVSGHHWGIKSIKPILIIRHVVVVGVAISCLIASGIISTITFVPHSLINGNYSDCSNETSY